MGKKPFKTNEAGVCPVCGGENLENESAEIDDGGVKYPWTCQDCGASGDEYYDISFSEHCNVTDSDGNEYGSGEMCERGCECKAQYTCAKCKRHVCGSCMHDNDLCPDCLPADSINGVAELLEQIDRAAAEVGDDAELSADAREGFCNGLNKARALILDILK